MLGRIGIVFLVAVIMVVSLYYLYRMNAKLPALPENPSFKNPTISTEERITDLLSYMSLEEKIGQMALVEKNSIRSTSDISKYGLGALLSGFGGSPEENTISGWKKMVDTFVAESKRSRLEIPMLYGVDAIHGHSNVPGLTVFPHSIGLGATGDEELVRQVAEATRAQLALTNINWSYSPTYDMPQDIRWGRVYETFSDDPELVSRLGSAYIKGLQNSEYNGAQTPAVLATPKHYLGAGSMLWDTSSNENFRIDQGVTPVNEQRLREIYLPPFEQAIEEGAMSIMAGLNSWGDTKLAAEPYLIQRVLKEELGFQGFVVSDWYGVYEISDDDYTSAVTAINAGVDMVMLPFEYKKFVRNIKRAVRSGDIAPQRIDDAVRRILRAKFTIGLFDEYYSSDAQTIDFEADRLLARQAVAQSAVLLKNKNVLPISQSEKTIFVAGSAADNVGMQAGAWTVEWQGVDGNWLPGGTSILSGIQSAVGANTNVVYNQNAEFDAEKPADIGIAIVGEKPYAEGWGDNPNPTLSPEDLIVIERLKSTSQKVIVVLVTGRPLLITDEINQWDGLVVVWLPGTQGGGVADVLFGKEKFTGSLPLPWPATLQQMPIATDGKTADGSPVLFERYFGL